MKTAGISPKAITSRSLASPVEAALLDDEEDEDVGGDQGPGDIGQRMYAEADWLS